MSRYDRDNYISLTAALASDGQYEKLTTANSYNYATPYDYGSTMHYGCNQATF
jgi:hypothetical protein